MKKMDADGLKKCALDILKDVSAFCDKNNINYSITDGTLLGAVRHQGFIPWDDDIDISMPRPDYDRFFSEYSSQFYNAVEYNNNNNYPYAFGKVIDKRTILKEMADYNFKMGVYIDVFPLDGLPDDLNLREKHIRKANRLGHMSLYKKVSLKYPVGIKHKLLFIIAKILLLPLSNRCIASKQIEHAKKYRYDCTDIVSVLVLRHTIFDGILKRSFSDKTTQIEFENTFFKCPEKYDEYLKCVYGDYMTPPPPEKRVSHYSEAYWV